MSCGGALGKRKRKTAPHPYLTGNFAPVQQTCKLTGCTYSGSIPVDLAGGQYVRNGSNPVSNEDLGREAHWFDGDGMLSGVFFMKQDDLSERISLQPEFANQFILTDVFLAATSTSALRRPILPSIATLVNPISSLFRIVLAIMRTVFIVILSRLPGSRQSIKKISVANTAVMYHDGRALATCESGPPLRVALPSLDTVGWFDGTRADGEHLTTEDYPRLGGKGWQKFMKEWTTAHPKVDPDTNDMILFHSGFSHPYVHYSVIPASISDPVLKLAAPRLLNEPVAGMTSPKMMHDFGVSKNYTVIMDLPLTLDPKNLARNKPPIVYDSSLESRFGVFPRHDPSQVRWFETSACCIFHTVNTWDVLNDSGAVESVDMLACRMTTAAVVFNAGNITAPKPTQNTVDEVLESLATRRPEDYLYEKQLYDTSTETSPLLSRPRSLLRSSEDSKIPYEDEQCRLYYYSFAVAAKDYDKINHQFALSAIPFEFPSVRQDREMSYARFVYGCTTVDGTFNSSLGSNSKIDALAKFDVDYLLSRAKSDPPNSITGCVDKRSVKDILGSEQSAQNAIQIFQTPPHYFAQEPRFAPRLSGIEEDDGFLLTYVFDESQLDPNGLAPPSAISELWIIDAKGMKDVLAKIYLPQRVPYGLHGNWFPESQILGQRPVNQIRKYINEDEATDTKIQKTGKALRNGLINLMGG